MVKLLIDHGADVHAKLVVACPLEQAVRLKSVELTELLIAHGAGPQDCKEVWGGMGRARATGLQGLFWNAIRFGGGLEQIALIEEHFGVFDVDRLGKTLLFEAFRQPRKWASIAYLVDKKVEVPAPFWRIPDLAKFLPHFRVSSPEHEIDWAGFQYKPMEMGPSHSLWRCRTILDAIEAQGGDAIVRNATPEELTAISSVGADNRILEFFAHFMPVKRGLMGVFDNLDWLVMSNYPMTALGKSGYFAFGSDSCGDAFAFAPKPFDDSNALPVAKFDHQVGYHDIPADEVVKMAQPVASDIADFFELLTKTGRR